MIIFSGSNISSSVIAAFIGIFITAIGTYFTLRFAWKRDKIAKDVGIATETGNSIERIMRGFSDLNESLQREVGKAESRINQLEQRLELEANECNRRIADLEEYINKQMTSVEELSSNLVPESDLDENDYSRTE